MSSLLFNELIPPGISLLIKGPPGSGKTEFALALSKQWIQGGENVVYVSISNPASDVISKLGNNEAVRKKLRIVDCYTSQGDDESGIVVYTNGIAHLESISLALSTVLDSMDGPSRIIIDGLSLLFLYNAPQTMSKFVQIISTKTKSQGSTTLFLLVEGMHERITVNTLMAIADGLIEIDIDSNMRRLIRFSYLKGRYVDPAWYLYEIVNGVPEFTRLGLRERFVRVQELKEEVNGF